MKKNFKDYEALDYFTEWKFIKFFHEQINNLHMIKFSLK